MQKVHDVVRGLIPFMLAIALVAGFFVAPAKAYAADATAGTYGALQTAINNAPVSATPYTIEITANIPFGTSPALIIPAGRNIVLTSDIVTTRVMTRTQTSTLRHFTVNGSLTLENIVIDGTPTNTGIGAGGGITVSGSAAKLNMHVGGVIRNCFAAGGTNTGGAVNLASGGDLEMTGGAMTGNAGARGGAIHGADTGSVINISGGSVSNNTSSLAGGAIYGYAINIFGTALIDNNTATTIGGGIWAAAGSTTNLYGDAVISNNSVVSPTFDLGSYGGGIGVDRSSSLTLSGNASIINCRAHNGGGVGLNNRATAAGNSSFTMSGNASITDCTAEVYGGGLYEYAIGSDIFTINMSGGTISGNRALNGGGVYMNSPGAFTMTGGAIDGNHAFSSTALSAYGGGVYKTGTGTFTMTGGSISRNDTLATAAGPSAYGGGVYVHTSTFVVGNTGGADSAVIIEGNTAGYMGGGIDAHIGSTLIMHSGTIRDNHAVFGGEPTYGGGVEVYQNSTFTMNNGTISGNSSNGYSGGVEVYDNSLFTMNNGSITDNTSPAGGGVSVGYLASSFAMNGGTIGGNTAAASVGGVGGGVYVYAGASMTVNGGAVAATIEGNTADYGGGVLVDTTSSVHFLNCSIINNTTAITSGGGGGGIYTMDETYANVTSTSDTFFSNNTALLAYAPPANALALYPWIGFASVSATPGGYVHPINNFDINRIFDAPLNFHVTFDSTGGSGVTDQAVEFGFPIVKPTDPTREGYLFSQWMVLDSLGELVPWNFSTVITNSDDFGLGITLYAEWTALEVTVSGTISGLDIVEGVEISYTVGDVEASVLTDADGAYSFDVPFDSVLVITPAAQTGFTSSPLDRSITVSYLNNANNDFLYELNLHTVSFNSNGGTSVASQEVLFGGTVDEPTPPTRTNYTFLGWYTDDTFSETWNFEAGTVTADMTLIAGWEFVPGPEPEPEPEPTPEPSPDQGQGSSQGGLPNSGDGLWVLLVGAVCIALGMAGLLRSANQRGTHKDKRRVF